MNEALQQRMEEAGRDYGLLREVANEQALKVTSLESDNARLREALERAAQYVAGNSGNSMLGELGSFRGLEAQLAAALSHTPSAGEENG